MSLTLTVVKQIEFYDFAHRMWDAVGGWTSQEKCVRDLFYAFVQDKDAYRIEKINADTIRRYMDEGSSVNQFCLKIKPYIEPVKFIEYIDKFDDAVRFRLVNKFSDCFDDLSTSNLPDNMSELFASIIDTAASRANKRNRKSASKRVESSDILEAEVINDDSDFHQSTNEEARKANYQNLIIQTGDNSFAITNNGIMNIGL